MPNTESVSKTIRLSSELNTRLETQANKTGVSQGYLIRRSLEEFLDRNEKMVQRLSNPVTGIMYRRIMKWASKGLEPERADELVVILEKIEADIDSLRLSQGDSIETA
ncbi:MAG: ribbon-helix-helix protein, CopG family [Phycisphaera sp.]|nr:MAG: ribbon-helix-helix protein, CopG family [Phycisphaera sp.]